MSPKAATIRKILSAIVNLFSTIRAPIAEYENDLSTRPSSAWLIRHQWDISNSDFYNSNLTEEDLRNIYHKLR